MTDLWGAFCELFFMLGHPFFDDFWLSVHALWWSEERKLWQHSFSCFQVGHWRLCCCAFGFAFGGISTVSLVPMGALQFISCNGLTILGEKRGAIMNLVAHTYSHHAIFLSFVAMTKFNSNASCVMTNGFISSSSKDMKEGPCHSLLLVLLVLLFLCWSQ